MSINVCNAQHTFPMEDFSLELLIDDSSDDDVEVVTEIVRDNKNEIVVDKNGSLLTRDGHCIILAQKLRPSPYKCTTVHEYPDFKTQIIIPGHYYDQEGYEIVTHGNANIEPWKWRTPDGKIVFTKAQWEEVERKRIQRESQGGNYLLRP